MSLEYRAETLISKLWAKGDEETADVIRELLNRLMTVQTDLRNANEGRPIILPPPRMTLWEKAQMRRKLVQCLTEKKDEAA